MGEPDTYTALEALGDAILVIGPDWTVEHVTSAFGLLPLAPDALPNEGARAQPTLVALGVRTEPANAPIELDKTLCESSPDGARLLETTARATGDRLIVRVCDITAARHDEEIRRVAGEQVGLCMEAASMGIYDYDLLTGTVGWSANMSDLMGLPRHPFQGSFEELTRNVIERDRGTLAQRLTEAVSEDRDFELDFRVALEGRGLRWIRTRGRTIGLRGKPERILGVMMEITREKLATEETLRYSEFQQQLIGMVSHDIRSPLGAIIAWSGVLADGIPDEGLDKTVRRISAAALRIERLTNLLLEFTRARLGGGILVTPSKINLHSVYQRIATELKTAYPDRKVLCTRRGDVTGRWDVDRMGQVFANLLDNALKYSPAETTVQVEIDGTEADEVRVSVHNEGVPISAELLRNLFVPFRSGPQQGVTAKVSYGLGLYIVREIVNAHGGRVEVRSEGDDGTWFVLVLPRIARPVPFSRMPRAPAPGLP